MAKLSRSNIAYDLTISPHTFSLGYPECDTNIRFIFSSNLYRENFETRYMENREKINQSLSNRFGFNIKNNIIADLKLYITIEKRGFLIYKDGVKHECLKDITLDGSKLIATT